MYKTKFIKKIDQYCGLISCLLVRKSKQAISINVTVKSILIIRPGGIGDAVLLIPAISCLKRKYPNVSISVLAEKRNASAFRLCPHVNQVLLFDNPKELLTAIRGNYDVVIDTEQWHRLSAVVARITGACIVIGYATNERNRLLTYPVAYSHDDYEGESFLHLTEPLGIAVNHGGSPFLTVPDSAAKKAETLLREFAKRPFVAIFPGFTIPEKQWDLCNFVRLAVKINRSGFPIVVIGSEKERAMGETITHGLDALNLAGMTSLVEAAAVIDKTSLLVSGDSGVLHIAAGLGRPTVSIFGPSNIKKWAPRGEHHIVVSRNLPCSPCSKFGYTPRCPMNAKCMYEIKVDEVFAEVEKLIKERKE